MAGKNKYTPQTLLQKFMSIHGDEFQYNISSVKTKDMVEITCKKHGMFKQSIRNHLFGQKCLKCRNDSKKIDIETFIANARHIHGETYDYSQTIFDGSDSKLNIICRKHGVFSQTANDHTHGRGCSKCALEKVSDSLENIKQRCSIIFPQYDYTNSYIDRLYIHSIYCPEHGFFKSLKTNHLAGHGCSKCAKDKQKKSINDTTEFIEKCKNKHNNLYTYEFVDINRVHTTDDKIIITCSQHGNFIQKLSNHLYSKHGCPKCTIGGRYNQEFFSKEENKKLIGLLYVVKIENDDDWYYKIGITKKSIKLRFSHNKNVKITELLTINDFLYKVYNTEQHFLKTELYRKRKPPKNRLGGDKECFMLPQLELGYLLKRIYDYHNS